MLQAGMRVSWLLNYRGGSFVLDDSPDFELKSRVAGVKITKISADDWVSIQSTIKDNNMEKVFLEKAPKIAVYTPPGKLPWDDAVTLALTYADIPYDKIYDKDVVGGKLSKYDWLHLHHEDFTVNTANSIKGFLKASGISVRRWSSSSWPALWVFPKLLTAKGSSTGNTSICGEAVSRNVQCNKHSEIALAALGTYIVAKSMMAMGWTLSTGKT